MTVYCAVLVLLILFCYSRVIGAQLYVFREVWAGNNRIQDEIGWYTTMSHWNTIQCCLDWL